MVRRRGPGEGTITQRTDGRWQARLDLGNDINGKRQRKTLYGKTYKEAYDKFVDARRDHASGLPVATKSQTVAQFVTHWLTETKRQRVRPKTYRSYEQLVRHHIIPGLGRHQLAKLSPQHVQTFLNAKLADGLSPRTVQYLRSLLGQALGQALKWALVSRNVATLVDPPKVEAYESKFLSPEESRRLLLAVRGDRLETIYSVALALGLRQGEILGLRWEDVDFALGVIRVRKQLQRLGGRLQLVDLKTRKSMRTLHLPDLVLEQLQAHRIRQADEQVRRGASWKGCEWNLVFTSTVGTPLEARNLVRHIKGLLTKAGLADMRFHDLRHSCGTLLIAQGVPAKVVQETLGHSQISLTLNTYVHILPEVQRQAATAMDTLFPKTTEAAD